ncbi:hypothetical protein FB451DRAFT_40340 [Mycena latifolia]|nr:hypothetical protein FB451DRAFT_40340 [Mycena latifolia]
MSKTPIASSPPPVVLFGYPSSPFTQKTRLALRLKRIPYTFVPVPSMLPRPLLTQTFHLHYRKIPVCAIGRDLYCDTALILEALDHAFPAARGYGSLLPPAAHGRTYAPLARAFASFWTDRPLFRVTTGLVPGRVWRTRFGADRADLIGHGLDAAKLEAKVPRNLSGLDLHLSMLEPLLRGGGGEWVFWTEAPSLADVALWAQLEWGSEIAAGRGVGDLTGGEASDADAEGAAAVFNEERYPGVMRWFERFRGYVDALPLLETRASDAGPALDELKKSRMGELEQVLVPTAAKAHLELDARNGLVEGAKVSVAPDDTGRADPTLGTLLALTTQEVVIKPLEEENELPIDVRVHFPRLGFVVKPLPISKL